MKDLPANVKQDEALKPGGELDWEVIRTRLASKNKADYWRSLDELAETPEFRTFVEREFPAQAGEWNDALSRRHFLQLMAASIALAGWSGCTQRQPNEKIVPYLAQPEELVLGKPLFYATAMTMGGFATGLLVKSREGRPVKIEGNPDHPFSLGATTVFQQASLLDLYDPSRSKAVLRGGEVSSWTAFVSELQVLLKEQQDKRGAGLRFLSETVTSPALTAQIQTLLKKFPNAKWHAYEPVNREQVYEGARLAFGEVVETRYQFDKARVILSLDSDFLGMHPGSLRFAKQFATGRKAQSPASDMNRLYIVETQPTVTGSMADHRLPLPANEILGLAFELFHAIASDAQPTTGTIRPWALAVAADLKNHKGASLVIPGDQQPPKVHTLAHRMNQALGNFDHTITISDPAPSSPWQQTQSLRELVDEIRKDKVDLLLILGGNPAFTAPVDLNFSESLSRVKSIVRLGTEEDETSAFAQWHIPEAHYLESWGDARAYDGTVSIH